MVLKEVRHPPDRTVLLLGACTASQRSHHVDEV